MPFNHFKGIQRYLDNMKRVYAFTCADEILDPNRLVNRAMFGTDYHPNDVALKLSSAMSFGGILQGEARDDLIKAYNDSLMQGFGILEHKWVNGQLTLGCTPPGEYLQARPL